MQLQVGEQRLIVCGVLKRCAPYEMDDGTKGFSGQVDFMGGWTKFSCDAALERALKPYVGKPVQLLGVPKVAGDRGQRGELKIGEVLTAWVNGQQIYSAASDGHAAPAAAVDPEAAATHRESVRGVFGRKAA